MEEIKESKGMHYEGDCIRPPPEAGSILLQVTLGCSHNKCTFCSTFKNKKFKIKDDNIILGDILFASKYMHHRERLFLMDGDALIIPQKKLIWILEKIREHLPRVKGVGSYANTKSISMKSPEELAELKNLGLDILYLGVESGDDRVRKRILKGSSAQHCVEIAKRVKDVGIKLVALVLLGIGENERSMEHAKATGEILSAIDPDFASALTLMLIPGTPLYEEYERGEFEMPGKMGMLREMREMIEHMNVSRCLFSSNHASNYLPIRAMFPEEKLGVLDRIDAALRGETPLKPEWMRSF
ncbi:radical SAM protein [Thermodesulfobacteriota bacterium]